MQRKGKKILTVTLSVILVIGLLVGAGFWLFKGNNIRTVSYDKALEDNVIMLVQKGKDNKETLVDIKTIKTVQLGDELVVEYQGEVSTEDNSIAGGDYMTISGVRKTANGRYVVVDNVKVGFVTGAGIDPTPPTPTEEN